MTNIERQQYDVVVIGAGGAGLRAAIEARLAGKRTAIISKSLFGKAHTVMAEGGGPGAAVGPGVAVGVGVTASVAVGVGVTVGACGGG